jgi:DNA helicase HerA-like ATPase
MDRQNDIHFARVDFRNDGRVFGIKDEDGLSHVYIIGKTGTGKSTLIETMAFQDLKRGNGFALIDPHGDLVERVAGRVRLSWRRSKIDRKSSPLRGPVTCVRWPGLPEPGPARKTSR